MWRRSVPLAGSYITNQRVIADWWQPLYRENIQYRAKTRLDNVLAEWQEGLRHTGEGGSAALTEYSDGADASLPSLPMTLYEANGHVSTFTAQRNTEDLSRVLQYVREGLGQNLAPYHYHALLRSFSYTQDKENAAQLLDVMVQNGESTMETYARVMDCLHCLAPADVLTRLLRINQLAQEAFGTLVFAEVAGSEGATVAAYGFGEERQAALEEPNVLPGPSEEAEATRLSSPTLSSLLFHLANRTDCSPLAPLLVAVWMRALGVPLGDWEYVNLLCCLLSRVEEFPRVRAVVATFHEFPEGSVSPRAVMERLEARGECSPSSSPMSAVVEAMRASLSASHVDLDAPVVVGVVNLKTAGLENTVNKIVTQAEHSGGGGLGSHRYSSSVLYHVLTLVHSTLHDETLAVRALRRALERESQLNAEDGGAPPPALSPSSMTAEVEVEPFSVSFHHLNDTGGVLARCSSHVLEEVAPLYLRSARRLAVEANQRQLQEVSEAAMISTYDDAVLGADGAQGRTVRCLASPPVAPHVIDLNTCEGYAMTFIRTAEEARDVLRRAVASVERANVQTSRVPRASRVLFRQFAEFCAQHPLPNRKLTSTGLEERRKWGQYLDARDTALALFGSAQQARDSMKYLYYHDNQLPELRSASMVAKDVADVSAVFFPGTAAAGADNNGGAGTEADDVVQRWLMAPAERTTLPHIRCSADPVPRHLFDPAVYNPYPHVMLKRSPCEVETIPDDLFLELWHAITDPATGTTDSWYVQSSEMYMALMRCLLYRLDWEAAAHLTAKMLECNSYSYLMDQELTTIFKEIGDPAGCLAFKVATKLFDGRILTDGQQKRDRRHQEVFS